MKIEIDYDEQKLEITDDGFDVDNFVNIQVKGDISQGIDVPIEELYTATKAFYEKRTRMREADNLIK